MTEIKTVEEWLGNNKLSIDIFNKKYRYENETFLEWLNRVSNNNEDVKQLILEKKFLFGGRILANRGLDKLGKKVTYSNCYVLPQPEDNIESIFDTAKELARTFSYGGGVGVDISKLSPRGAKINNTAKETTGSVSFMDLYSLITELIGQSGRRGALMISISCEHPDLEEFINVKSDLNKVTKANISVRMTKKFMEAVKSNSNIDLSYTRNETNETITKTVNARDMFMQLAKMNWDYAEPGILFWDNIESYNLMSNTKEFKYAGTNPCAEEPLPAGGSCLLGSLNLSEFVVHPFTEDAEFDLFTFRKAVKTATYALNEVMEEGLNLHPLEVQRKTVSDWKQIGLGIFGLADMLIKMGITYGSKKSLELCDNIGFNMADEALLTSTVIAEEKGMFDKCSITEIITTDFLKKNTLRNTRINFAKHGLRNSQLLTIAPTGSLSTMLGVSGGIEPIFANSYTRKTESLHNEEQYYKVYTPIVEQYMKLHSIKNEEDLPEFFITSQNLNYKNRIDMQSIWQQHIDASISSTVNVPNDFTIEDTFNMYLYAYEKGLKGLTMFRDGCARVGVLTTEITDKKGKEEKIAANNHLEWGTTIIADDDVIGKKRKLQTGCGSLHCTAFFDPVNGRLLETYLSKGSQGGCNNFMIGLSRMISHSARTGASVESIADQLLSCGTCPSYAVRTATKHNTSKGSSCPVAIGYALLDMYEEIKDELGLYDNDDIEEETVSEIQEDKSKKIKYSCPECGEELTFEGGCNICRSCGYSRCD